MKMKSNARKRNWASSTADELVDKIGDHDFQIFNTDSSTPRVLGNPQSSSAMVWPTLILFIIILTPNTIFQYKLEDFFPSLGPMHDEDSKWPPSGPAQHWFHHLSVTQQQKLQLWQSKFENLWGFLFAYAVDPPAIPRRDSSNRGSTPSFSIQDHSKHRGKDISYDHIEIKHEGRRKNDIKKETTPKVSTSRGALDGINSKPAPKQMTLLEQDSTNLHEAKYEENGPDFDVRLSSLENTKQPQPPTNQSPYFQKQREKQVQKGQHQNQKQDGQKKQLPKKRVFSTQEDFDTYMHWCETVLGIQTVVEVKEFEYIDHLLQHWQRNEKEECEFKEFSWLQQGTNRNKEGIIGSGSTSDNGSAEQENSKLAKKKKKNPPTTLVRGLVAAHDIQVGDIVISIPLNALITVATTIDHDPVLSRVLGPAARERYGWTNTLEHEVPLLVVAILYHRSLGRDSHLWHYIDVLMGAPTETFPFLWSDTELRQRTGEIGIGVRDLARGIRQDLYELYDSFLGTLVREHPEIFGPPDVDGEEEVADNWLYSFENFKWAFAMVISRHHYLPIQDIDEEDAKPSNGKNDLNNIPATNKETQHDSPSQMQETLSTVSEIVPPANQPTDSWVELAKNQERGVEEDAEISSEPNIFPSDDDAILLADPIKHSFLAPLADLINFGPPCLTGAYNEEEQVFELIATCPFETGQEVTFWYSSDCADVIVANYGFLHPLVPPCTTLEEWKNKSENWKEKAKSREAELWELYREMDMLREELAILNSQLVSCGCEDGELRPMTDAPSPSIQTPSIEHDAFHQKLRKGHEIGVRGRMNDLDGVRGRMNHLDEQEVTRQVMEELG